MKSIEEQAKELGISLYHIAREKVYRYNLAEIVNHFSEKGIFLENINLDIDSGYDASIYDIQYSYEVKKDEKELALEIEQTKSRLKKENKRKADAKEKRRKLYKELQKEFEDE